MAQWLWMGGATMVRYSLIGRFSSAGRFWSFGFVLAVATHDDMSLVIAFLATIRVCLVNGLWCQIHY
ncbi:hypothetical protein BDY21DRAFT_338305 [Lineolata rhizophorae]|uniref:Uncharacterized protein n=1 Tax=Lineolata rhizophorae TaxID=578093 RepID=A0A6A6P624_9PEZI|nr:hypothetical protein BDY21DRAFT_338305 [Lineolata rhizophorae]